MRPTGDVVLVLWHFIEEITVIVTNTSPGVFIMAKFRWFTRLSIDYCSPKSCDQGLFRGGN
jgi:hypothetical protein